jgi:hypothetical protein
MSNRAPNKTLLKTKLADRFVSFELINTVPTLQCFALELCCREDIDQPITTPIPDAVSDMIQRARDLSVSANTYTIAGWVGSNTYRGYPTHQRYIANTGSPTNMAFLLNILGSPDVDQMDLFRKGTVHNFVRENTFLFASTPGFHRMTQNFLNNKMNSVYTRLHHTIAFIREALKHAPFRRMLNDAINRKIVMDSVLQNAFFCGYVPAIHALCYKSGERQSSVTNHHHFGKQICAYIYDASEHMPYILKSLNFMADNDLLLRRDHDVLLYKLFFQLHSTFCDGSLMHTAEIPICKLFMYMPNAPVSARLREYCWRGFVRTYENMQRITCKYIFEQVGGSNQWFLGPFSRLSIPIISLDDSQELESALSKIPSSPKEFCDELRTKYDYFINIILRYVGVCVCFACSVSVGHLRLKVRRRRMS